MIREDIIKKLEKEFINEDKTDPFLNREYVDETKRIFRLLKGKLDLSDNNDRAMYDISADIFRYFENKIFHIE